MIELDDSSHERQDRRRADAKKTKVLGSAGVPLIRWNVKSLPDEDAIKAACLGIQRPTTVVYESHL